MISFYNNDTSIRIRDKRRIQQWVNHVVEKAGFEVGDLNIISCSDKSIEEINIQFLNHHYPTDIITFDSVIDQTLHGELYIGLETIKENAKRYNQPFQTEIKRVIIHGVLHLMGYKDKTTKEKEEMRRQEDAALQMFHVKQK
ncbi:rRNA maturation RNase YbeY [Luteibaculum oceani]|uniref:Endoribonuclease YbeY n=1 Tax=Luteibaculum oceani TaxID=1294296 RepID=A0A5C6VNV4_9FLAO|nr:rRNA maturation RNase YbeY [Luteibaculum oceani]TXC85365.1 rRNA maturation RNase YbeY [Luteibaculum oceani]